MTLQTAPNSGIPAGLTAKRALDADETKLSHAEVNYAHSTGADRCSRCVHYLKDGPHCELVEDPIEPSGWCERFTIDQLVTDSALTLALDRESVREFDKEGRLHVAETNICKACVSPYRGQEINEVMQSDPNWVLLDPNRTYHLLRDPEALKKATPTLNGIQLLRKHIPVNAEDHQPWDVAGAIGTTAKWQPPYIKNGLSIWSAPDIEGIKSGEKRELSPGYHYRAVMEPGTFDGESFDGKMLDIVFNHVALVENGRQGRDVVVGDSADEMLWSLLESELTALAES